MFVIILGTLNFRYFSRFLMPHQRFSLASGPKKPDLYYFTVFILPVTFGLILADVAAVVLVGAVLFLAKVDLAGAEK